MKIARTVLLLTAMLASGCATTGEKKQPVALKDHPGLTGYTATGETKRCINVSSISVTTIFDDWTMLFRVHGKYYVNRLPRKCSNLEFYHSYLHNSFAGDMCKREIIYVIESNNISPVPCYLGEFLVYTKNKKQDE